MNKILSSAALILLIFFTSCQSVKEEKTDDGKYAITHPVIMDTSFNKEYVADIQSVQNVEIRAKVKGYIAAILVDEGQRVHAGQVLFTIRPREYQAELMKAKANVKTAELDVMNTKVLADKNIVSQNELAAANAKLDEANAEENLAELYVSYTTIRAPFDGIIDRIKFKHGSLIDEGTLLTTISNNTSVYAYFNVSELEYLDYKSHVNDSGWNSAKLLLANNQLHKYPGFIETIEGEFDNNTGTIPFRAKFPNPELLLKHGETGKVQLKINLKNALIIPQRATFELQDKTYVYVIDQNNKVSSRNINVKQRLPNIYVIDAGLSTKDRILLEGIQSVKEDDQIQTVFIDPIQALAQPSKQ